MEVDVLSEDPLAPVLPEVEPIAVPNALPVVEAPQPNWKDVPAPVISEQDLVSLEAMRSLRQSPWNTIPLPDDWKETQAAKQAAGERDATVEEIQEANKLKDEIDPIFDLPAKDLAGMAEVKENEFDLVSEMLERRPQWTPELQTKVAEAHRILNERRRILPTGKDIVESGLDLPTTVADWAAATFLWAKKFKTGVIGESAPSPLSSILSGRGPVTPTPEEKENIRLREQKAAGEAMAATSASMKSFGVDLPLDAIEKVLGESPTNWTPEKSAKELADKISRNIEHKNILAGGGTDVPQFSSEVRAEMKAGGADIDPAESAKAEAGDPFSLMAIGPAFRGIGAVLKVPGVAFGVAKRAGLGAAADAAFIAAAPAEIRGALLGAIEGEAAKRSVVGEVSKAAGEVIGPVARAIDSKLTAAGKFIPSAQTVVGKSIQSAGVVADTFAKWVEKVAPVAVPLAGAVSAAGAGGALPFLGQAVAAVLGAGGTLAYGVRPVMATLGAIRKQAQKLGYTGKSIAAKTSAEIAETPIRGSVAAAIKGAAQSVPGVVEGAVNGAALDISLSALTTLTSDNHSALQLGTALGIAGGLRSGLVRTAGEVNLGARDWGHDTPVPTSGTIGPFESMSASAYLAATRGIKRRVNALRQLLRGTDADADMFMSDPARAEQRQVSTTKVDGTTYVEWKEIHTDTEAALLELGYSKAEAEFYAGQNGWFDAKLPVPGQPGKTKRVIVVNNVDSAPHEAKHAFQNVNGELANQVLDRIVRDSFNDEMWDFLGRDYTEKLLQRRLGPNESWMDLVLEASGEGAAASDLKIALRAKEGIYALAPGDVQGGWRQVLTPAERKAVADKYIAREIAAETFDTVFKHFGPALAEKGGLISFFAKFVAATTDLLGGDPLRGRTSEVLDVPLKPEIVAEVTAQVRGRLAEVAGRKSPSKPVVVAVPKGMSSAAPPGTPEQEAEKAKAVVESAPDEKTGPDVLKPDGTLDIESQTAREVLGATAETMALRGSMMIDYRSAPGTPAGVIEVMLDRRGRRGQVEEGRGMSAEDKILWEKLFTPIKVAVTQAGEYQVQGLGQRVLGRNANEAAKFLAEVNRTELSPFEIDVATQTFTEAGWRNLFDKITIYNGNQAVGLTGRGTPLDIGRAREFGFYEPAGSRQKVGDLTDAEMNFINYLFGYPLPGAGKPVLARGGKAQYAEQLISQATEPGRAQPLVIPRGGRTFESAEARKLGFAGEQLLEVNPLRAQIEQAARDAGREPPSPIEVWQNLNLRDIVRVQHTPELPSLAGNEVTKRAGLSPKPREKRGPVRFSPMPANEMAIRSAAIRDENGRIFEGAFHSAIQEIVEFAGSKGPLTDGFVTNRKAPDGQSEFLDRDEAFARAEQIGQLPKGQLEMPGGGLETMRFEEVRKFSPKQLVTPESEKRFGSSAVRFEDGTLKPVFHGTVADFHPAEINTDAFQAHFGAPSAAAARILGPKFGRNTAAARDETGAKTMPVFLDIKTPLRLPDAGNWENASSVSNELYKRFGAKLPAKFRETTVSQTVIKIISEVTNVSATESAYQKANFGVINEMKQWLQKQGYDGVVYKNEGEVPPKIMGEVFNSELGYEYGQDSYIAFSNDQVHSALKFSPKRKEIELIGPDGLKYKASFDGYMDMSLIGLGQVPQITPLVDLPGSKVKGSTTYGPSLEKAGYKLPADLPPPEVIESGEAKFSPPKKDERTGVEFTKFFSDVSAGKFGKSDVPFKPLQDLSDVANVEAERLKHWGNFENHIQRSIPMIHEEKTRLADGIIKTFGADGARLLDIGSSEGDFGKTISALTDGKIETVSLEPNPDMAADFHRISTVKNATITEDAFLNSFENHPAHEPVQPYDIINEAVTFQFINPNRDAQVAEVKRMLKPDGIFLSVEKFKTDNWAANEAKKDKDFKDKYFTKSELAEKESRVGFEQSKVEQQSVGMVDNMVSDTSYIGTLQNNFKHVIQYWDSGNFKGFAASDSLPKLQELVKNIGDLNSEFSTVQTPREFPKNLIDKAVQLSPSKREDKGYAAGEYWLGKTGLNYAPEGHLAWSDNNIGNIPAGKGSSIARTMLETERQGFLRTIVTGEGIEIDASAKYPAWKDVPRSYKEAIEDLQFSRELPVFFDGKLISERPGAKFSPKREQFEDAETIREALSSPGWAVIGNTQEAVGKWNTPANIESAKALEAALQAQGYEYVPVKGTYKGVPQGVDYLVLGISTYDAQALGKKYKQESVLTPKGLLYGDGTFTPGDVENTMLGAEARKQKFFSTLPNGLSFSVPLDFSKAPYKPVGEQSTLFGGREYESPANFTQAELKQRYPEAIVPGNSKEKIGSDIVNSPLHKQSADPINAFADKLIEFAKQYEDNPVYQLGLRWYSDIVPMLKKEFGADAPMATELLAASSPNEKPAMNFFYMVDALEGFKSGRFDKIISKFNEGFELYKSDKWLSWYNRELKAGNIVNPPQVPTPEAFLANWIYKHDLKPKQSNGQLYGFHGRAILEVLAGKWLQQNKGPKVGNFVQNLQGTGHEATVDVWLDRTFRRVGYADAKNRWRIMPANGEGVSDADFAFAQKATRAAAERLGILPDALQGGLWFAEKRLWSENGWGLEDLGSYAKEMEKLPMIRQAIKQRLTKTAQRAKVVQMKTGELQFSPKANAKAFDFLESLVRRNPNTWLDLLRNGQNFGINKEFSRDEANELLNQYLLNPDASYSPKLGEAWKKNVKLSPKRGDRPKSLDEESPSSFRDYPDTPNTDEDDENQIDVQPRPSR